MMITKKVARTAPTTPISRNEAETRLRGARRLAMRSLVMASMLFARPAFSQQCSGPSESSLAGCVQECGTSCLARVTQCSSDDLQRQSILDSVRDRVFSACCGLNKPAARKKCLARQLGVLNDSRTLLGAPTLKAIRAELRALQTSVNQNGTCTPPTEAFFITSASYPTTVDINGARGDLVINYTGNPAFPVTAIYDLNPIFGRAEGSTTCPPYFPPNFSCLTISQTFDAPTGTSSVTMDEAVFCFGSVPNDIPFDYVVYLRDANGVETPRFAAPATCNVP